MQFMHQLKVACVIVKVKTMGHFVATRSARFTVHFFCLLVALRITLLYSKSNIQNGVIIGARSLQVNFLKNIDCK